MSEWADRHRKLSPESSAEPGQWYTSRAEYLRGIMDAFSDPLVEEVVCMTSSQVGKTETLNNVVGFFIHQDPSPILVVQPTVEMAETWSKDRLAPMLRDTPVLANKVKEPRTRDSGNTLRVKVFPNGRISIAGANSAASLASRPVRIVLQDEIDRFPPSAGTEGSPIKLADKRAITFWNRKFGKFSTPTIKGASAIEREFDDSDQRRYFVPCPECSGFQTLKWGNLKWDKAEDGTPVNVRYECEFCRANLSEQDKFRMIRNGRWIPGRPERAGKAGFHISELYSPWSTWRGLAEGFHHAKKSPDTLKVWINTSLGETWEEEGVTIDDGSLLSRVENYGPLLPAGIAVLTAGVDVQDDRIEVAVKGWGRGEESWLVEWKAIQGNPQKDVEVWNALDTFLLKQFPHTLGTSLRISATCVDSGHATKQVYEFVRKREARRVWAIKGLAGPGRPVIKIPNRRQKKSGILLGLVGVDTCKGLIYSRLLIDDFGPGYMHFPKHPNVDAEYFKQLTAEKMKTKFIRGFPNKVWEKIRARNEALDAEVYALASLASLNADLDGILDRMEAAAKREQEGEEGQGGESPKGKPPQRPHPTGRRGGGFTSRW